MTATTSAVTPAALASLYADAACLIGMHGYYGLAGVRDEHCDPTSLHGALRAAARNKVEAETIAGAQPDSREIEALAEELQTRLAGVLFALGERTTRCGVRDMADEVAGWDSAGVYAPCRNKPGSVVYRSHNKAEALRVLGIAATMFGSLTEGDSPE